MHGVKLSRWVGEFNVSTGRDIATLTNPTRAWMSEFVQVGMRLPALAVQLQGFAHSTEKRLLEFVGGNALLLRTPPITIKGKAG